MHLLDPRGEAHRESRCSQTDQGNYRSSCTDRGMYLFMIDLSCNSIAFIVIATERLLYYWVAAICSLVHAMVAGFRGIAMYFTFLNINSFVHNEGAKKWAQHFTPANACMTAKKKRLAMLH